MNFASRYRPGSFDDLIGQDHLVSPGAPFRKLVESGRLPHSFLYGPPGCGKTTLARIVAEKLDAPFHEFNATGLKIEEIRKLFSKYRNSLYKPLVFIDEVHRMSKNQQEVLLPYMESGSGIVMGASTQNPYYSLLSSIRSRSHLFEMFAIDAGSMKKILLKVSEKESLEIEEPAFEYLLNSSGGDVRAMLNLLESACAVETPVTLQTVMKIRPSSMRAGSAESGAHYDLISAMIKSVRGSDIDAGLYYLAMIIEGGEPPEYIARRLVILASEDIGNANPNAVMLAVSIMTAVEKVGYPEASILLSQLLIYLSSSPKSNSAYLAIKKARKLVENGTVSKIPDYLAGNTQGYLYPHDYGGWVEQDYGYDGEKLYEGGEMAYESRLKEWHSKISGQKDPDKGS